MNISVITPFVHLCIILYFSVNKATDVSWKTLLLAIARWSFDLIRLSLFCTPFVSPLPCLASGSPGFGIFFFTSPAAQDSTWWHLGCPGRPSSHPPAPRVAGSSRAAQEWPSGTGWSRGCWPSSEYFLKRSILFLQQGWISLGKFPSFKKILLCSHEYICLKQNNNCLAWTPLMHINIYVQGIFKYTLKFL